MTPLHVAAIVGAKAYGTPGDADAGTASARAGGAADVPPLVLLHGFTGDTTTWRRLAPHFGNDRTVLAVDLVGHGQSPDPTGPAAYTMASTVASVVAAIRGRGCDRAHWLGYSMGGRVALALAVEHPPLCAGLVLVGASPGLVDIADRAARAATDEAEAARIERDGLEAFVERWMDLPLFRSQAHLGAAYLEEARAQRLANRPFALAACLRGMGTGVMPPLWERLCEIETPVLLATGALDAKFGAIAARMAERIPHALRLVLPGAGHAVHVEAPGPLAAATRAFLRDVDGGRVTGWPSPAGGQS